MKAIITAGGKGTRLYPITRAIPKELINFAGVPVLEYGINYLKQNGITDIIVVVGTKKGPIMDYLGNGELFGVNIAYVVQEEPLGLGHSILTAEHMINNNEDFIVLLGDTIFLGDDDDNDLQEMIGKHRRYKASATIAVEHIKKNPERYGIVKFNKNSGYDYGGIILSVVEKPILAEIQEEYKYKTDWTCGWYSIAGLYILNKKFFNYLRVTEKDVNNEIQLTDAIKLSLNLKDIVFGPAISKRIDVGSWDYIKDEKEYYTSLTNEEIQDIIDSRKYNEN